MSDMLDAALAYARRGWHVFPLHSMQNGRCSCGTACGRNAAKHPRTRNGLLDADIDQQQIVRWWTEWPDANIGVRTGPESGIWVIDQDNKQSVMVSDGIFMPEGENSLRTVERITGEQLPETLSATTGSGGRHWVFAYPDDGERWPNAGRILPSVDIRGDGGYIVAAPSVHANGQRYRWDNENSIAEAPKWFLSLERERQTTPFEFQEEVVEGGRNSYLIQYAGKLRSEGHDGEQLRTLVVGHNQMVCRPPLELGEVLRIVQNIMRYPPGVPMLEIIVDIDDDGNPIRPDPEASFDANKVAISFGELMRYPPEPRQPLIHEGLLDREDGFIIAGQSGVGKSWLAYDMALAVASGSPWLGSFDTTQGPVVYVDEEGSRTGMYRRLGMLARGRGMNDLDIPLHLAIRKGLQLDSQEGLATISRIMWEHRPVMMILDTLVRVHGGEENSAKDMASFFRLSNKLREAYGCAIGFIHHIRKPGKDDVGDLADMIRGSSDIRGWPDSILIVRKDEGGEVTLHHGKSREHEQHKAVQLDFAIDDESGVARITVAGNAVAHHNTVEGTRWEIVKKVTLLQTQTPVTASLIAGQMNMSERTIKDHLKALVEAGWIQEYRMQANKPATYMAGHYAQTESPAIVAGQ